MPDFFYGKPIAPGTFPPDTEEKRKTLGDFFAGPAEPGKNAGKVPEIVKGLRGREEGKDVGKWGSVGMCWGGKVRGSWAFAFWPFPLRMAGERVLGKWLIEWT